MRRDCKGKRDIINLVFYNVDYRERSSTENGLLQDSSREYGEELWHILSNTIQQTKL